MWAGAEARTTPRLQHAASPREGGRVASHRHTATHHVGKQAPDLGCQVQHMGGLHPVEHRLGGLGRQQVCILAPHKHPALIRPRLLFADVLHGTADQPGAACHQDDLALCHGGVGGWEGDHSGSEMGLLGGLAAV